MTKDELKELVAFLYPLAVGVAKNEHETTPEERENLEKALQIHLEVETGSNINLNDIRLERTCYACPEQYDAFLGSKPVGYLRLRHGRFYTSCPDVGGDVVYVDYPRGDGIFDEDEREHYLFKAKAAILHWLASNP